MLKTKKSLGLILTAVVFAGCTTVAPQVANQNNTTAKVEAVKVDPVFDLGEKNGASAKINLKFNKDSKFGIKDVKGFASGSINPASYIVVKLHKVVPPATMTSPDIRFNNPATLATPTSIIDGSQAGAPSWFKNLGTAIVSGTTLTFSGLHFGTNYYVSARAYSPANVNGSNAPVDFVPAESQITIAAGVVSIASGAYTDFNLLQINPGDIISIGSNRYTVTSLIGSTNITGLNVVDFATGAMPANVSIATGYNLWRNVISANGTTTGVGGGTQGADGGALEEFISISPIGLTSITNDVATANGQLDIKLQLMQDYIPLAPPVSGNIAVNAGNTISTATESITSP